MTNDSSAINQGSEAVKDTAGVPLPCPFCGNVPNIVTIEEWYDGKKSVKCSIKCEHHGRLVPGMAWFSASEDSDHTDAIIARNDTVAAWNTRAPAAPLTPPDPASNADETKE